MSKMMGAIAAAVLTATSVAAQERTAMEVAIEQQSCGADGTVVAAQFVDGDRIRVQCEGERSASLWPILLGIVVAGAAAGGGSSSTSDTQ